MIHGVDFRARSYKHGQIAQDEVQGLLARLAFTYKTERALAGLAELDDYSGDIFVADGDLHVNGDLDLLRDHLDRELLEIFDDEDEAGNPLDCVDGIKDIGALKRRVRAGSPLHT